MGNQSSVTGGGVFGIVLGLLAVCAVISFVTGKWSQWPLTILGIVVGLTAVKAINR